MDDRPYLLRDPIAVNGRLASIDDDHVRELNAFVRRIREEQKGDIPWFDPWDGGQRARVLFLLEAPGGKAVDFVSTNNPDPTARRMHDTLGEFGIHRDEVVFWNVVPWYVGDENRRRIRAVRSHERGVGVLYLRDLIELLPVLEFVVLLGEHAKRGWNDLKHGSRFETFVAPHPSNRCLATSLERRERFRRTLQTISSRLEGT